MILQPPTRDIEGPGRLWRSTGRLALRGAASIALVGLLSGCGGVTRALTDLFVPGAETDAAEDTTTAADIPYASIEITFGGTGGLLLLTESSGDATFWRSGQNQIVVLTDGDLTQTEGLRRDLLSRSRSHELNEALPADGGRYSVRVSYESRAGDPKTLEGMAVLECSVDATGRTLPLATLPLRECRETVEWQDGSRTRSTYWKRPDSGRIWEAHVVPWPGAPVVDWKVARPWW